MEIFAFFGLVLAAAIFLVWRSRRGTSSWRDTPNAGLPDDLRGKNPGHDALSGYGQTPWHSGGQGGGDFGGGGGSS